MPTPPVTPYLTQTYSVASTNTSVKAWATLKSSNDLLIDAYKDVLCRMVQRNERARVIQSMITDLNDALSRGTVNGTPGLPDGLLVGIGAVDPDGIAVTAADKSKAFLAWLEKEGAQVKNLPDTPDGLKDPQLIVGYLYATVGTVRMWIQNLQDSIAIIQQPDASETQSIELMRDKMAARYEQIRGLWGKDHESIMSILQA